MKKIIVDIFSQEWDDYGLVPIENIFLYNHNVQVNIDIEDLSNDLRDLILNYKNDGLELDIVELKDLFFVKIFLIMSDDYLYIVDYLNNIGEEISYPDLEISRINMSGTQYFLSLDKDVVEDINHILDLHNIKVEETIDKVRVFEKGAGDWHEELLLRLAEGLSVSVLASYIYEKLKSVGKPKYFSISEIDYNKVVQMVSNLTNTNSSDFIITQINYNPVEQAYWIALTSRHLDVKLKLDNNYNVLYTDTDFKTQTKI